MQVVHPLLTLPVHKRTREKYYQEHDEWMERQKPAVEKSWRCSFEELPPHIRIHWQDRWYWPPWFFNDVVGFVQFGCDEDGAATADVYLKRRYFRLSSPERIYRDRENHRDREAILYFWSIAGPAVDPDSNASYVTACHEVLAEASRKVQQYGRGTHDAQVWLPVYDLDCFDFARARRQSQAPCATTRTTA